MTWRNLQKYMHGYYLLFHDKLILHLLYTYYYKQFIMGSKLNMHGPYYLHILLAIHKNFVHLLLRRAIEPYIDR